MKGKNKTMSNNQIVELQSMISTADSNNEIVEKLKTTLLKKVMRNE